MNRIFSFKNAITFILTIAMLVGTLAFPTSALTTADATDATVTVRPSYSITINEYDVYVATRKSSKEELMRNGISEEEVHLVKSNAIEEEITRLSKLSFEELSSLGYNNDQIEIIHNYNGESIETNSTLRGIFADMTVSFYNVAASTTSLTLRAEWAWTDNPILAGEGIKDLVAIRWEGTNTASQPMNLAWNQSGSSCVVSYYSRGSNIYQYSRTSAISTDDVYGHVYAKVPMSTGDANWVGDYYAKEGSLTVKVDRVGTGSIQEAAFVFAYGHTTVIVTPSLSLPLDFSIDFSFGTETMVEGYIRMDNRGNIIEY